MIQTEPYGYPVQIAWEVTNRCNLNCLYCMNLSGASKDELTSGERFKIVDEMIENHVLDVIITGGEPLMLPEIFSILQRLKSNGVRITLLTNGTLLDCEKCRRLKDLVDIMQVSLDAAEPDLQNLLAGKSGAHSLIIKGVDLAIKFRIPLVIGAVVNRLNYLKTPALAEFCIDRGIERLSFSEMMLEGRALQNRKDLEMTSEERVELHRLLMPYKKRLKITGHEPSIAFLVGDKKESVCDCSLASCAIAYNGDILPCSYIRESVGSVKSSDICSIWNSSAFHRFRKAVLATPDGQCADCRMSEVCRGGCKGLSWSYSGKINAPNPVCVMKNVL